MCLTRHFLLQKDFNVILLKRWYYVSGNVTLFEETSFFPSSLQEVDSVQQILPILVVEPLFFPTHDTLSQPNPPNSSPTSNPPESSSPPIITYQHRLQVTSPI